MGKKLDVLPSGSKPAQEHVREQIRAGKVKKKCCQSKPRCKKCPVLALRKAESKLEGSTQGG